MKIIRHGPYLNGNNGDSYLNEHQWKNSARLALSLPTAFDSTHVIVSVRSEAPIVKRPTGMPMRPVRVARPSHRIEPHPVF